MVLTVAACGSDSGDAADASTTANFTWTDEAKLEAAAKEEGTLDLYVNGDYDDVLVDGFKKAYPWATVNATNLDSAQASEKWSAELSADVHNVDVAVLRLDSYKPFVDEGAVAKLTIPNGDQLPASARDADGYTWAVNNLILALLYNTKLADGGPSDLHDLADPEWKGKLVMPNPAEGGAAAIMFAAMKDQLGDDWETWLKD